MLAAFPSREDAIAPDVGLGEGGALGSWDLCLEWSFHHADLGIGRCGWHF